MSGFTRSSFVAPPGGLVTYDRETFSGTGDYTFTLSNMVIVKKTVGAATTVFLPVSPTVNGEYVIKDGKGDAATNNITVNGNGNNIEGAGTYLLNNNYGSVTLFYDGSDYIVIGERP